VEALGCEPDVRVGYVDGSLHHARGGHPEFYLASHGCTYQTRDRYAHVESRETPNDGLEILIVIDCDIYPVIYHRNHDVHVNQLVGSYPDPMSYCTGLDRVEEQ
jgi:hypothetical protein